MKKFNKINAGTILIIVFLLFVTGTTNATNYYVSAGGDNNNPGNKLSPWKTIDKVNAEMVNNNFNPGDSILFERGSWFFGAIVVRCSGNVTNPIVFGAYGTGSKPVFIYATQENLESDWIAVEGRPNIWENRDLTFYVDVANLVFPGSKVGRKLMNTSSDSLSIRKEQGHFWYDFVNNKILIYSVDNPATYYSNIQCVLSHNAIEFPDNDQYIVFENLDFRYYGKCVVEKGGSNCTFKDLSISYIGGADYYEYEESGPYYKTRYGHGLRMWNGVHDVTVTGCNFDNIYDAAIAIDAENNSNYNLFIRNNVVTNCETSFIFFDRYSSSNTHDIYIEHNTCVNAGYGWSHDQRWYNYSPNPCGTHFLIGKIENTWEYSNISILSNIYYGTTNRLFWILYPEDDIDIEYEIRMQCNCFFDNTGKPVGTLSAQDYETLPEWQDASNKEQNSIYGDPLFVSAYSKDFHLRPESPLIGKGLGGYIGAFGPYNYYIGNKTLSSQADVDAFNYLGVTGSLTISGPGIANLNSLSSLIRVGGSLDIIDNVELNTLTGLRNLTSLGQYGGFKYPSFFEYLQSLNIHGNASLTNLDGLQGITTIPGDISIWDNASLTNLDGLNNLANVEADFRIFSNVSLINLDGLNKLTSVDSDLDISWNPLLTNLNSLEKLNSVGEDLYLSGNTVLSNLGGLQKLSLVGGRFNIYSNDLLTTLYGLEKLTSVGGDLEISQNGSLTNLDSLHNLTTVEGAVIIEYNDLLDNLDGLGELTTVGFFELATGEDDGHPIYTNVSVLIENNSLLDALPDFCGLFNLLNVYHGVLPGEIFINGNGLDPTVDDIINYGPCGNIYNGDLILSTQDEVNRFHYTKVTGSLTISGENIENLTPLLCLDTVGGGIRIESNPLLTTLSGLQNLASVGATGQRDPTEIYWGSYSLVIHGNGLLANLDGLQNLDSLSGYVDISGNASLSNLDGLQNLTSIGQYLSINNNASLNEVDAFQNLTIIGGLEIRIPSFNWDSETTLSEILGLKIVDNSSLTELNWFKKLNHLGGDLEISSNISLTNMGGFQNLTSVAGRLIINNNDALINLDSLQNLNTIAMSLVISGNSVLENLAGLKNLFSVGTFPLDHGMHTYTSALTDLVISENETLLDLNGLINLSYVGGSLLIGDNNKISSFKGLENLNSVGENYSYATTPVVGGSLSISNNDALNNLNGLQNLMNVRGDLNINDNEVLTNLDGLQKLVNVGFGDQPYDPGIFVPGDLNILSNPVLDRFCGLYKLLCTDEGKLTGELNIDGNKIDPPVSVICNDGPCPLPVANAGPDQVVDEGTLVTLDGSASFDPDNDAISWKWTAPEGITLSSETDSNPTFTAPEVTSDTEYMFYLGVNDGLGVSPTDEVIITVKNIVTCPHHFHTVWEGTNGTDHMNINIIKAQIDGIEMAPGDEIGVFDGGKCVGYGKLDKTIDHENLLNIKASRDDGTGNGFIVGHEILYKVWDCSADKEIAVTDITCYNNQLNQITCQSFEGVATAYVELSATNLIYHTSQFKTGWNIFSEPCQPEPAAAMTIFQELINNNSLVKVQDETGNSIENWGVFGGWKDNIGNISPTEGYKVKVNKNATMVVCGMPVGYPFDIELTKGWNIIGYPHTAVVDATKVVQQLINRNTLVKVQDESGNSLEDWGIFGGWKNNIVNFVPGKGYKIKVKSNDTLSIDESYPKSTIILPELLATYHFKTEFDGNGITYMNINLVGLPVNYLRVGDELAVFDGTTCVGAVTLMPHHLQSQTVSVIASATDNLGMKGFTEGNPVKLKLWRSEDNQEFMIEPEIIRGTATFKNNETTFASLEKYKTTGVDGIINPESIEIRCYPNPFSDEVTIEINLAEDSQVQVEVLNPLGQMVKIIKTKQLLSEGSHIMIWNGKSANNQKVTPGVCLLRVNIEGVEIHKKIVYSR
jgi:hypothetical protein